MPVKVRSGCILLDATEVHDGHGHSPRLIPLVSCVGNITSGQDPFSGLSTKKVLQVLQVFEMFSTNDVLMLESVGILIRDNESLSRD